MKFSFHFPLLAGFALSSIAIDGVNGDAHFDLFDDAARSALKESIDSRLAKDTTGVRSRQLQTTGGTCRSADGCSEGLSCVARRCIPAADSCFGKAVSDFTESFDSSAWLATNLGNANITEDSLVKAARSSGSSDAFQSSDAFKALVDATSSNMPDEINGLQDAVDACVAVDERAPTTNGMITYLGVHIELSAIADLAVSVFWPVAGAGGADPDAFIRGTFGVEAGVGAEVSALVGIAFTGFPVDILGDSVVLDADAGGGPHAGGALVINMNGLISLEFTLGVGAGGGVGIGYGITEALPLGTVEPGWYLANPGESCDDTCKQENLEGSCNEDAMNKVDSDDSIREIIEDISDFTCDLSQAVEEPQAPAIQENGGQVACFFVSGDNSKCDASFGDIPAGFTVQRLCCCGTEEDCPA